MDIKEIAMKVAMDTGLYLDGANQSEPFYVVKPKEIVEFAEALIESYKAELLKEAGEPVAKVVSSGAFEVPCLRWTSENASLETLIGTELFTSDQIAAAVLKATKPLEEEVERLKGMVSEIQAARHVHQEHNRLLTQLAAAQEEMNGWRNQARQSQSAFDRLQDQLAKANQLWQVAQGRCDGLEEKLAKAEQRVAEAVYKAITEGETYEDILAGEWRKFVKKV